MATCQRNMAGVDRTLLIIEENEMQEIMSSNEVRNKEGRVEGVLQWVNAFNLCASAQMLMIKKEYNSPSPLFSLFIPLMCDSWELSSGLWSVYSTVTHICLSLISPVWAHWPSHMWLGLLLWTPCAPLPTLCLSLSPHLGLLFLLITPSLDS